MYIHLFVLHKIDLCFPTIKDMIQDQNKKFSLLTLVNCSFSSIDVVHVVVVYYRTRVSTREGEWQFTFAGTL